MISLLSFIEPKKQRAIGSHLPYYLRPIEVEDFLVEHDTLIKRLKVAYSDSQSWDSKIFPSIRELALMCGHLPYSANGVFSEADGLFKAGILAATYAIEIMESTVQLEKNIMAQHLLQGRLKAVAALAGLCAFLDVFDHKITIVEKLSNPDSSFFHLNEANHTSHLAYEPLAMPYTTWVKQKLADNPLIDLELHWNSSPPCHTNHKNLRLFYARHILLPETLSWLADAGQFPLMELMKCLTIESDVENVPSSVIKARNLGVYRACLLERERIGSKLGEILAPDGWQETLIRILRARILNDWAINAKDSPLRKGADGLFLFWPDVCPILIDDMKSFGLTDLPTDPDIWAGCLLNSGITVASKNNDATCWIAVTPNAKPREAIKLSDEYFFTSGKIFQAKTIKRDFETKLSLDQSSALSQLTREILESSNQAFTQKLPTESVNTTHQTFIWQLKGINDSGGSSPFFSVIFDFINSHQEEIPYLLIDEGIFLTESLNFLNDNLTFERLVTSLLTANLIYQNDRGEPLWVSHTNQFGELVRGVILKPNSFEVQLNGKLLSFKEIFQKVHVREPNPNFSFLKRETEPSDQLAFNFDEEAK